MRQCACIYILQTRAYNSTVSPFIFSDAMYHDFARNLKRRELGGSSATINRLESAGFLLFTSLLQALLQFMINNFISIAQVTVNVFNYDTIPGKGLLQFLEKKKYTDVNFVVEGHQVPAHRCVVAAQSDYFDCLLFGSMKEARSDEIVLEDTPLEAFRVLLHYMYSGSVKTLDMQVRGCHDCLLYTTQIIGIETIWDLHTLTK